MKLFNLFIFICCPLFQVVAQNESPVYERIWATYFGGQSTYINDSTLDKSGNIYIAGMVFGQADYLENFTTSGVHQTQYGGGFSDGIIAKFTPSGLLVWATFFGGTGKDDIFSLSVTEDNHLMVGGTTNSSGLATVGVHQTTISGSEDAFIAKFDLNGQLFWCTYYGGNNWETLRSIATDRNNNVYIGGLTQSSAGIGTPGTFHPTHDFSLQYSSYNPMGFIAKFNDSGQLQWGTYYGNNSYLQSSNGAISTLSALAVNDSGLFVVGEVSNDPTATDTANYFATEDAHQSAVGSVVGMDAYLSKFSLINGQRIWSTYYGGNNIEKPLSFPPSSSAPDFTFNRFNLAASENYIYIGGGTRSFNNIATPDSFKPTLAGAPNGEMWSYFIAKFDNSGSRIWGTYLGNIGAMASYDVDYSYIATNLPFNFYPMRIALNLDKNENVVASGSTVINNLASEGSYQQQKNNDFNCTDAFTTKISSDGTSLIYGTYYGGEYNETATRTLIRDHVFYLVGTTQSPTAISTSNSFQEELNFETLPDILPHNGYIAKFATEEEEVSISDSEITQTIIYPNPNNGVFYIELNQNYIDSELYMFDINGRVVHQQKINNISTEIETHNLQKGMYLLKIVSNQVAVSYQSKIVIE